MNNKARHNLAFLSLLGSLASVACGDSGESETPAPFTPAPPSMTVPDAPTGTDTDPATPPTTGVSTGSDTDGVVAPVGGVTTGTETPDDVTDVTTPPVVAPPSVDIGTVENSGSACEVTAAGPLGARSDNLPDPFKLNDGTRVTTKAQWECRRNEIKKDIEQFEIGTKPEPPTVAASLSGTQLNVVVTTPAGSITLTSNVATVDGDAPHCVAIGMGGNSSLINGCVEVPFAYDQVVNLNYDGTVNQNDPFYTVYPELRGKIANYAAWSWGISRIIDGLDQVKDELNVDMSKIGVHGCSAAGKMALFGGALDERVALTLVQESGGGGVNSWRLSQDFVDRTQTQIEKIDNTNYSWFLQSMRSQNPYTLPHDHHELIAMIAPRAVVIFGNRDYEWLGDESGFKSTKAAQEVWKAFGAEANFGYDFTTGHAHCSAAASQVNSANAFINKVLKGQDADTNIAIAPPANGFDLDQTKNIDWETPILQ
jgi:glucuronyl esterase-like protein